MEAVMALFRIDWTRGETHDTVTVNAENWMAALDTILRDVGLDDAARGSVVCDVEPDGSIRVYEPGSGLLLDLEEDTDDPTTDSFAPITAVETLAGVDALEPAATPSVVGDDEQAEADLEALVAECDQVSNASDVTAACEVALDILLRHLPAESASVLLHLPSTGEFEFVSVRGPSATSLHGTRIPADAGIAGIVLYGGRSMLVRHASRNPHHYREVDKRSGYRTRAIIAAPIRGSHGIHGVIEVLNPLGSAGFSEIHQDGVGLVAGRLGARIG